VTTVIATSATIEFGLLIRQIGEVIKYRSDIVMDQTKIILEIFYDAWFFEARGYDVLAKAKQLFTVFFGPYEFFELFKYFHYSPIESLGKEGGNVNQRRKGFSLFQLIDRKKFDAVAA